MFTDRTKVFRQFVNETLPKKRVEKVQQMIKNYTTKFGMEAAKIGKEIHETKGKLIKLKEFAKKKTLFDDPSSTIQELTYLIKKDITALNTQIEDLVFCMNKENQQTSKNSENIICILKIQLASTTNEFRKALEIRTENIKKQQCLRSELTGNSLSSSNQPYSEQSSENNGGEIVITIPNQTQLRDYSLSRLDAVQTIERTIVELEGIFRHLVLIIEEQGESIDRIDNKIEDTSENLNTAKSELLKYWSKMSSSRSLTFKIFFVVIVFLLFFFVII